MKFMGKTVGFALTGSFCTYDQIFPQIEALKNEGADIIPIMSEVSVSTDTRFGCAADFVSKFENICGKRVISSINTAEPIGPKGLLDLLIVLPATGNTISKIARGITDTCVTMAVKGHLRNERPVLIGISTNDGLSGSFGNISSLMNRKNVFFVPFGQDDAVSKPNSLVAKINMTLPAALSALEYKQLQPVLM